MTEEILDLFEEVRRKIFKQSRFIDFDWSYINRDPAPIVQITTKIWDSQLNPVTVVTMPAPKKCPTCGANREFREGTARPVHLGRCGKKI